VIIFGEKPSYDEIYEYMILYIIYYSAVCQMFRVNRNNFRSFYEEFVKNALKTKKIHLKRQKVSQYHQKHILYLRINVLKRQKKDASHQNPSPSDKLIIIYYYYVYIMMYTRDMIFRPNANVLKGRCHHDRCYLMLQVLNGRW